ncbi:AGAP001343-PA-like protein [Anopheles sinensis]|uniref:Fatty acyl-CoA reductase n=1 Tax=Anopheles sinensis TaxID=74873 RepID=A0A084VS71_ANOSI|nr:AGAP001343-PA-like protein [Anopheles sinensis]
MAQSRELPSDNSCRRSDSVFDRLAKKNPNYQDKIKVIEGDLEKPNFDLCPESMEYLREHTNVILHIAATVKFDEEMIKAITINLGGTRTALEIGRQAKNLQSFVYVSTAYSNSYDEYIQERVYPVDCNPEKILANLDDEKLIQDVIKYSHKWPNTYTFTKALAETLTLEYRQHFPIAILRPSCVMSSLNEPMPGWCDSIFGTNGTFIGWYYGLIRTSHIDPDVTIDTVPVDYVSNAIIAVGWKTYIQRMSPVDLQLYPCDNRNYTWRLFFEVAVPGLKKYFFKEDLNNVRQARLAMRKKELIVNTVLFAFVGLILLQLYYLLF